MTFFGDRFLVKRSQIASLLTKESTIIGFLFLAKILIHLLNPEYGYFRDELFYITVGDLWSLDNLELLPLTPLFLKFITHLFGYSLKSIHFASALCGALSLLLTCLIAKELGGKKYAIFLAGLFNLFSGFIVFGSLFTYDSLDFLIQTTAIYLLVKIISGQNQKIWILVGFVLGLGLLNKLTILIFGFTLFISLWLLPHRIFYKSRWIWFAGILGLLFSLPFVIWQTNHDWYFLETASNYSGGTAYVPSILEFIWSQILPNNIASLPVWLLGLWLLLFSPKWKKYRFFGFMYVGTLIILFIVGGKFYFSLPLYSILFVVGSIRIEEYFLNTTPLRKRLQIFKIAIPSIYFILTLPVLPILIPIFPPNQLVHYASYFGVHAGVRHENISLSVLPQHMADRFGWEEMVDQVNSAYVKIEKSTIEKVGILVGNYGQGGAIHVLGQKYHLPEPISLNSWYYYETLRSHTFLKHYLTIGIDENALREVFNNVTFYGEFFHPYAVPHENNKKLYSCSDPKFNLKDYWMISKNTNSPFIQMIINEGIDTARSFFLNEKVVDPSRLIFTESQMNQLGYQYLGNDEIEKAIEVFKFNIEIFPLSFNVYDSYGEGLMADKQYQSAILNYQKSVELNPNNENGKNKLKELILLDSQK